MKVTLFFGCLIVLVGAGAGFQSIENRRVDVVADDTLKKKILDVASEYAQYQLIEASLHWSPLACSMPPPPGPLASESNDTETHGGKLYFMFAKEGDAYRRCAESDQPVGQAIVKQSWTSKPAQFEKNPDLYATQREFKFGPDNQATVQATPYLRKGDAWFEVHEPAGLFIMLKTGEHEEADEGWIYATTNAAGTEIRSIGKLNSCIECHADAPRDRMFGIDKPWFPPGPDYGNSPANGS